MNTCFWRRQVYAWHETIGWWHIPRLYARLPLGQTFHTVVTNAAGMRAERDYSRACPPGRQRIAFLGDSYTAGDGVSNGQRFTDLLERRFPRLDAMNFGLNGSGTDQQLLIWETMARDYSPDACVFCICVENIARNGYTCFPSFDARGRQAFYRPKPYFEFAGDDIVLRHQPVPKERRPQDALGDWRCTFPHVDGDVDPYAIYARPDSRHWRLMKRLLQRFVAGAGGRPVLIVPLPMCEHYLGHFPPRYLARFAELANPALDVHVIDLLPVFLAQPAAVRAEYRFPDDPHYTATAHALVADALEYHLGRIAPSLLD